MHFSGKLLPIKLKPDSIPRLLKQVREIYDLSQAPNGVEGCKDCQMLDTLLSIAGVDPAGR
jgi:hypothetical protein